MEEFQLKLGPTTYVCSSNYSGGSYQNWNIKAKYHDLSVNMSIPIESKVPLEKVLIFISCFDEALRSVQKDKSKELNFINQLT